MRPGEQPGEPEQGVEGYNIEGWFAAIGPKGLSPKIVDRLNAGFRAALSDPMVRQTLIGQGNAVTPGTPAEAEKVLRDSIAMYGALVKQIGLKLQ